MYVDTDKNRTKKQPCKTRLLKNISFNYQYAMLLMRMNTLIILIQQQLHRLRLLRKFQDDISLHFYDV